MNEMHLFHQNVISYLEGTTNRKVGNYFARMIGYGYSSKVENSIANLAKRHLKLKSIFDHIFELAGYDRRSSIEGIKDLLSRNDENDNNLFFKEVKLLEF